VKWTWLLTGLSLIGVILNIRKLRACFYIWLFTNAAWMIVDFHKGLPAQGCLFAIYVILAIWGIVAWKK
jgi:nicotinamide riboside transporter PnuC